MKICFLDGDSLGGNLDLSAFNRFGEFTSYSNTSSEEVKDRIKDCEIVISNKIKITQEDLQDTKVKLIAVSATGTNIIDIDACSKKGIAVTNVAGYSTKSVAQHTLSLTLALLENICYYKNYTSSGEYKKSPWATNLKTSYYELAGKNWGIIGLGNIGKEVATLARAFGCNVVYYSTTGNNVYPLYERVSLDEMLKMCDIISVHSPLNSNTHDLVCYDDLKKMKSDSLIVNVARGGIINEKDIAIALNENILRGYATDVLETEPMQDNCPLLDVEDPMKLIMTPHTAFCSDEARSTLISEIMLNIESFLKDERRNRLD